MFTRKSASPADLRRESTRETPRTDDLRGLMSEPNFPCQVGSAVIVALPQIPDRTSISDIGSDLADVKLSTATELVPRSKRLLGAQG